MKLLGIIGNIASAAGKNLVKPTTFVEAAKQERRKLGPHSSTREQQRRQRQLEKGIIRESKAA